MIAFMARVPAVRADADGYGALPRQLWLESLHA